MIQKFPRINLILFGLMVFLAPAMTAQTATELTSQADRLFEQKNFTEALDAYEVAYQQGLYSQQMLYRLAFMHENMEHYPDAIYYLKKIQQEYGGEELDAHISKLMRLTGNDRYYTQDAWNTWNAFYMKFSLAIILAFSVGLVFLLILLLRPQLLRGRIPLLVQGVVAGFFLIASVMLFIETRAKPHRAVIVKPTSFYKEPGFSASNLPTAIGLGETVDVTGLEDIWVCVNAGGADWWVPRRTIRPL